MLFIAGCNRVAIYHNLSEEDANAMIVLLQENGIEAEKVREVQQNEVYWSVEVSKEDLSRARQLLVHHNLPRQKALGLTGVYKEKGLIPTPDEQKARYLLALKGEIVNSLLKIPEIVEIDVVLNIPTKEEFSDDTGKSQKRPTASVVVRVSQTTDARELITESKIKEFVANSVEGLNPRDVAVIITYLPGPEKFVATQDYRLPKGAASSKDVVKAKDEKRESKLVGLNLTEESKERLKIYLLIFFVALVLLSSGLIIAIVYASRLRRKSSSSERGLIPSDKRSAVEGEVLEDGEEEPQEGEDDNIFPE